MIFQSIFTATYLLVAFFLLLYLVNGVAGRFSFRPEIVRKGIHMAMGLVCLPLPLLTTHPFVVLFVGSLFLLLLEILLRYPGPFRFWDEAFKTATTNAQGEYYFVMGIYILWFFSERLYNVYVASILILSLADPAAAFCGNKWGKSRLPRSNKTLEGSLAFFIVTFFIAWVIQTPFEAPFLSLLHPLFSGLTITFVESLAHKGSDNFWIAVSSLIALQSPLSVLFVATLLLILLTLFNTKLRIPGQTQKASHPYQAVEKF